MTETHYWLMKSEPSEVSFDDLLTLPNQEVAWFGVRNYQARNFMMRDMAVGDGVLFYHSNCAAPGIAGLARVSRLAEPDISQFDPLSPYFDPRATPEHPRWHCVHVQAVKKTRLLTLAELRRSPELHTLRVLTKGNRLSITPVTPQEWETLQNLLL